MKILRWSLLLALLLVAIAPVRAQDDDGGAVLDPALQWQLAQTAWDRRQYDDAAALNSGFAEQNPDDPHALDALFRNYTIYRSQRPDEAKRKAVFTVLVRESTRWAKLFATSTPSRAAQALWIQATATDQELGHPAAIPILLDIIKKYPDEGPGVDSLWTLAEWDRAAGKYLEAAGYYDAYAAKAGNTEQGVMSLFREAWMQLELKNLPAAQQIYQRILAAKYNHRWGQFGWGSIDAAERLKTAGDAQLSRKFALLIQAEWSNNKQMMERAAVVLNQDLVEPLTVEVMPHTLFTYSTDRPSITPQTPIDVVRDLKVLVRVSDAGKDAPFKGHVAIIPNYKAASEPTGMTKGTQAGKTSYEADIAIPDAKGNVTRDWWYSVPEAQHTETPPDDLVVTRTWKTEGKGWGEATIRIQSSARWHIWITLPNDRTNVNNISGSAAGTNTIQPNDVGDKGRTFHWNDWYDLDTGLTVKIPIEVGADTKEYYPQVKLSRNVSRYKNSNGAGKEADYDTKELTVKVTSDKEFPYRFTFPANTTIMLNEVKR